jgi:phosphoribosylanthranilate isomerase
MPRIKVCGIRRLEDVAGAFELGLDAVGLVAWSRSPRAIACAEAAQLVARLPLEVLPVAVFVDATRAEAQAWVDAARVRAVQLCGRESAADWRGFPALVIRRVAVDAQAREELEAWRGIAGLYVLDHPRSPGGTGEGVDLALAAELARSGACLLAGGLDAGNVAERIARVRPLGVDASSRLESAPGTKDPRRVREYVAAARAALELA